MLLHEFLQRAAEVAPKKAAFVCGSERRTYPDLLDESLRLAGYLDATGIGRGDRVCLMLKNSPVYMPAYYACSVLGATITPINPRLTTREATHILQDSAARSIIYHPEFDDILAPALGQETHLISVGASGLANAVRYDEAILHGPYDVWSSPAQAEDIALQIYTSGTTGQPKGAMLSHRALTFNALTGNLGHGLSPDDVFLTLTPLGHAAAGVRIYNVPCVGATHITMEDFDADEALRTIERERVTHTVAVPTVLRALLESSEIDRVDLSSLRLIAYGAAPMPQPLAEAASLRFPGILMHAYGLTEGCPFMTRLPVVDHFVGSPRLSSIGLPAEGMLLRIVDDNGADVERGQVGEIIAKSDKNMSGYWNRASETAATLREGWLYTGDLARQDSDGYFYLVDRKKDMIISGGFNVYPQEIEDVIHTIEGVRDVAVVGMPDEKWGEVAVAFVSLQPGATVDIEDLRRLAASQLANYKRPKSYRLIDDMPRNPTGKILKHVLRTTLRESE